MIMRRHVFIFIASLLMLFVGAANLWAGSVTPEQAKQIASQFLNERNARRAPGSQVQTPSSGAMTVSTVLQAKDRAGQPYIYAVSNGGQDGFVLVSGDERFNAILGYSANGRFDEQTMPDNMRAWLQGYIDEMRYLDAQGYQPVLNRAKAADKAAIEPLVFTTWNQGAPYNNLCPLDDSERSATGCVATAMAQIISYHMHLSDVNRRPTKIIAEIPGYTTATKKFVMPAIAADTDLPTTGDLLYNYTGSEGLDQIEAVANLMLYCGVSMQMDYTAGGSGVGGAPDGALKTYFGFDSTTRFIRRGNYTYRGWMDLIYAELAAGRPVYHSGAKAAGGHAFVVDGYQNGLFHINWGWGGHCNDYFALSVMDPDDTNQIGAATSNDGYTIDQQAVIGIQYGSSETYTEPIVISMENYRVDGQKAVFSAFNETADSYDWVMSLGIIDAEGNITQIGSATGFGQAIAPNSGSNNISIEVPTNADFAGQTKKIVAICRLVDQQTWYTFRNPDIHFWSATYDANGVPTLTVHPTYSLTGTLSVPTNKLVSDAQKVQLVVTNNADEFYGQIFLFASTTQDKGAFATQLGLIAPAGNTTVQFEWTPTAAGTYNLWVATDDAGNNVIASGSVTIAENPCIEGKHIMFVDYQFDNQVEGSHRVDGCEHTIDVIGPDLTGSVSFKNIGAAINEQFLFTIAFDDEEPRQELPPDIGVKGYSMFYAGATAAEDISFTTTGSNALEVGRTYRIRLERLTIENSYVTNRENLDDRYYVRLLGQMISVTAPTARELTYTGNAQELVAAGSAENGYLEYSLNGTDWSTSIPTATNAGDYTVYYRGIATGLFANNPGGSVEVTIAKAFAAIGDHPMAITGLVYTGLPQVLISTGEGFGGHIEYRLGDNGAWSTDLPTAVNAGNYTVGYRLIADDNHIAEYSGSVEGVMIAKASLTITADNKTISSTQQTLPEFTVTYSGFVNGETADVLQGTLTFESDYEPGGNDGEHVIMPHGVTSDNYEISIIYGTLLVVQPTTLDDDDSGEITDFLQANDGQTIPELTIDRPVINNMYNTLCLPFDMTAEQIAASSLNGVEICEFDDVQVEGDNLFLYVSQPVNSIVAGRPYMIKFSAAEQLDNLRFENVTINNALLAQQAVTHKGVTFHGTFAAFHMDGQQEMDMHGGYLFLGRDNKLYWPNADGDIKPFRAYFYVDITDQTGAPIRRGMPAYIGEPAKVPTAVTVTGTTQHEADKLMRDGVLYIRRNGVIYNVQGQMIVK